MLNVTCWSLLAVVLLPLGSSHAKREHAPLVAPAADVSLSTEASRRADASGSTDASLPRDVSAKSDVSCANPAAPVEAKPFPLKTVTLKTDGEAFYVEGRMVIPSNAKVVSLRATRVTGRGDDATLVIEGELQMRAVTGGLVVLENVELELARDFHALSLMQTEMHGTGGIVSDEKDAHEGTVYVSGSKFVGSTKVALRMTGGTAAFSSCSFAQQVSIQGVPRSEKAPSQLEFGMQGCKGDKEGVFGGLRVVGIKEANLAFNDLAGTECLFSDVEKLKLYGNNVRAERCEFAQTKAGRFGGTDIEADDFRAKRIVLTAPPKPGAPERVKFTSCWFGGGTDAKTIRAELFEDAGTDPKIGAVAELQKVVATPVGMGGGAR
ncbi:MAG: hypothetical protein HZA52_09490 [Planctomycetes bacterium]|nr:hypothetical protein [Planctomycetota bacterium]